MGSRQDLIRMPVLPSQPDHGQWEKRGCCVVPGAPWFIPEATKSGAVGTLSCEVHNLLR